MAKWVAGEEIRAGLRHAVVYPNGTGRIKDRIVQSKCVRAGSLAKVDYPQVARTLYPPCVFLLVCRLEFHVVFLWRYVVFRFRFAVLSKAAVLRSVVL